MGEAIKKLAASGKLKPEMSEKVKSSGLLGELNKKETKDKLKDTEDSAERTLDMSSEADGSEKKIDTEGMTDAEKTEKYMSAVKDVSEGFGKTEDEAKKAASEANSAASRLMERGMASSGDPIIEFLKKRRGR